MAEPPVCRVAPQDAGIGTEADSLVSVGDSVGLVRHWESAQHRVLVDPSLASWEDMDSEAVVLARHHWRLPLPSGRAFWSRRRYLSFDRRGVPDRLIDVQLLPSHGGALKMRQADLQLAAAVGRRYWVYALTPSSDGRVHRRALCDPAAQEWDSPTGGCSVGEPLWVLPVERAPRVCRGVACRVRL